MIEYPQLPAIGRMTGATIFAKPTLVHIVLGVTADTAGGRSLERLRGMTLRATNNGMQPKQRIAC